MFQKVRSRCFNTERESEWDDSKAETKQVAMHKKGKQRRVDKNAFSSSLNDIISFSVEHIDNNWDILPIHIYLGLSRQSPLDSPRLS